MIQNMFLSDAGTITVPSTGMQSIDRDQNLHALIECSIKCHDISASVHRRFSLTIHVQYFMVVPGYPSLTEDFCYFIVYWSVFRLAKVAQLIQIPLHPVLCSSWMSWLLIIILSIIVVSFFLSFCFFGTNPTSCFTISLQYYLLTDQKMRPKLPIPLSQFYLIWWTPANRTGCRGFDRFRVSCGCDSCWLWGANGPGAGCFDRFRVSCGCDRCWSWRRTETHRRSDFVNDFVKWQMSRAASSLSAQPLVLIAVAVEGTQSKVFLETLVFYASFENIKLSNNRCKARDLFE
jgi:hypothetical protein